MKSIWQPGTTLESVCGIQAGTMSPFLGIEFVELGADFLRATMPVTESTCQPMRVLHGGASVVLAETLASTAANCTIDTARCALVGQEINANHLRSVRVGGLVTGRTSPFHLGARSQVWGIEITDERGRLICVSRITMARIERPLIVPTT